MSLLNKITQSWVDAEKERVDVLTRFDSTDYRPACSVCGKDFTESEWDNRHTDPSDNLGDCHAVCCSTCDIFKRHAYVEKCEQCEVEGEELTDGRCRNCRDNDFDKYGGRK